MEEQREHETAGAIKKPGTGELPLSASEPRRGGKRTGKSVVPFERLNHLPCLLLSMTSPALHACLTRVTGGREGQVGAKARTSGLPPHHPPGASMLSAVPSPGIFARPAAGTACRRSHPVLLVEPATEPPPSSSSVPHGGHDGRAAPSLSPRVPPTSYSPGAMISCRQPLSGAGHHIGVFFNDQKRRTLHLHPHPPPARRPHGTRRGSPETGPRCRARRVAGTPIVPIRRYHHGRHPAACWPGRFSR